MDRWMDDGWIDGWIDGWMMDNLVDGPKGSLTYFGAQSE